MGKGIEKAKKIAPEHAALMDDLKDQLLIVFLRRLGGTINIPAKEVDEVGNCSLAFSVLNNVFHFELKEGR